MNHHKMQEALRKQDVVSTMVLLPKGSCQAIWERIFHKKLQKLQRHKMASSPSCTSSIGMVLRKGAEKPTMLPQGNLPMESRDNQPPPVVPPICQRGIKGSVYSPQNGDRDHKSDQRSGAVWASAQAGGDPNSLLQSIHFLLLKMSYIE